MDTREWLLTNGLGSYASGTVCDARTRTYHGWLIAALNPPAQRTLLLSHLDASLELAGQVIPLGTNFWAGGNLEPEGYRWLRSFTPEPTPTWMWGVADRWQLERQLLMPYGLTPTGVSHRLLLRYRYHGQEPAILHLRPLIADRALHRPQQQTANLSFSQLVGETCLFLQAIQAGKVGTPWHLCWTQGHYQPNEMWYWSYYYPEEAQRGLNCLEDLYSPGYLTVPLQPGESVTIEVSVGLAEMPGGLDGQTFDRALAAEMVRLDQLLQAASPRSPLPSPDPIWAELLRASDRFLVYRSTLQEPAILAGYHWFGDRSRSTLLSLPGFALTTQRFDLARHLLDQLGQRCWQGLIPNVIPDNGMDPVYRSIDCSLWWVEILGLYLNATQDWDFLRSQYGVVKQIYKAFTAGTLYNIRVDASDGLVTWDNDTVALTWMNTLVEDKPITPRHGKPIEINALWYSALCWASRWAEHLIELSPSADAARLGNQARRYAQQAEEVRQSLQKFWHPRLGYLCDRIEPDDRMDVTIRPNAVIALSLHHCAFSQTQAQSILQVAHDRLLTPYGLRSLEPQDPAYVGTYDGNPPQRDRAAYQGTVWSWLLGPFLRSWQRFHPDQPVPIDLSPLLTHFRQEGGLYGIAEMFDGQAPHHPRGVISHAVALAELLRYWRSQSHSPQSQQMPIE